MKKLATKDPVALSRPQPGAAEYPDRMDAHYASGTPEPLKSELIELLGEGQVLHRTLDLTRYASDASAYRLIPNVVVRPRNADDVSALMRYCQETGHTMVFRAGGSSLNGQALSDDILVDARFNYRGIAVEGDTVRVRSGEVLRSVNTVLARYGRKLGPDPASESVATIGGVLANNSGGMRCDVPDDSYHAIVDAHLVLPSGTQVDTSNPYADAILKTQEPELYQGIIDLRDEIRANPELVARLRHKFSIRNTNGLRLDAFLDEDTPARILMRLLIGAEGTLGFISEARLKTLPLPRKRAAVYVMLPTIGGAADYVHAIMEAGASACELMVAPVLREAVGNFKGAKEEWTELSDDDAALLVEVAGVDEAELEEKVEAVRAVLADAELTAPLDFMYDKESQDQAWQIRGGLLPLFGLSRRQGATLITEDACVPPAEIGAASKDIMRLLDEHGFPPMVMGHAAFGNLHFFLTPLLTDAQELENYDSFLVALADLIVNKYDGSLKAEHGTGRNMAPFVLLEWGEEIYQLFWRVKRLLDPHGILAPDVKLTANQHLHLEAFKSFPEVEKEVNDCIECGFCEETCPSHLVTVTPRQRIVVRREMARQPDGSPVLEALQEECSHDAVALCAADATCAIACPVSIDTGALMKRFRAQQATPTANKVALTLAQHWDKVELAARTGLSAADAITMVLGRTLGGGILTSITDIARTFIDEDLMPSAQDGLPPASLRPLPATTLEGAAAVYFPACINRMFGRDAKGDSLAETLVAVSARAGKPVFIPEDVAGTCCATPFSSKGYTDAKKYMARKLAADFVRWSDGGRLPVVVDAASCTFNIVDMIPGQLEGQLAADFAKVRVIDAVEWAHSELLPALRVTHPVHRVAVHPNCSIMHLDLTDELVDVANFVSHDAFVPRGAACCGTAGDRGLLHPELLEGATHNEVQGLREAEDEGPIDAYVSANRTCEMGMSQASGRNYEHVLYLLNEATR